jgi:hypothetical protein
MCGVSKAAGTVASRKAAKKPARLLVSDLAGSKMERISFVKRLTRKPDTMRLTEVTKFLLTRLVV